MQEWRLLAVQALVTLILTVVVAVLAVLVAAVVVGVAKNARGPGHHPRWTPGAARWTVPAPWPPGLPPLLSMAIMLWLFLRLSWPRRPR